LSEQTQQEGTVAKRLFDLLVASFLLYLTSPHYVRKQSLGYDLRLLGEALQALFASRGNVKARGTTSV
jgi:hypothetical protein